MAYNVHEFKSGDKLYAAQLNEMDAQIAANAEEIDTLKNSAVTSWNDLTDKPFGEKEEWVEHIPETSVTFSTGGSGEYKETFSSYGALAYGDYKVIFDGKEYYVSAVYQGINMMPAGEMSEEMPFQFLYSFGKLYAFKPGKHTISVYRKQMVVTPIPKKYIPWGVTWIDVYASPLAYADGTPMTRKQFVDAMASGPVYNGTNHDGYIEGGQNRAYLVIGYNINDSYAQIEYFGATGPGQPSAINVMKNVVFAEE